MEKLYYDRENKKFYVKELNIENNVVTDEQYVDVTDEIVTLIQEHVTKDGKKVICLDTTSTIEQEQSLKSLRPQSKQEWSKDDERRRDGIIQWLREYQKEFNPKYDSLSIESIESLIDWLKSLRPQSKRDCKDCAMFLNGECTKPHWKPSEEQMEYLLMLADYFESEGGTSNAKTLREFHEQLRKL